MTNINYNEKIPNNVNLSDDRRLLRALEKWQPAFLDWWGDMGPVDSAKHEVFLRTAVSVDREGWAQYGFVNMPDYRWGIFLADPEPDYKINFGQHKGQPAWTEVPGEYRAELRRLIVTQGDTEPASVEQQRLLGQICPSIYDLRSLFQVNVEEGRHLWAMVYLLHAHFGRDGREEAEEMLERHSGDADKPRILQAFNEKTEDWLSFFLFTYFQDRDGKYQLSSLAESGFEPLSRTCRFMLTEEAHHMYVGETGFTRVAKRAAELMKQHDTADIRPYGGIDLKTLQKYVNFHFSICLDLFGQERSTNAANFYTMGLKGRFQETRIKDDHQLDNDTYPVPEPLGSSVTMVDAPALTAINERLRNDYREDCQRGIDRINKVIAAEGVDYKITLPHTAFHRGIGTFVDVHATPDGQIISPQKWEEQKDEWLPTDSDRDYVRSLMVQVVEPGKVASWVAPPPRGVADKPIEFEYVHLN